MDISGKAFLTTIVITCMLFLHNLLAKSSTKFINQIKTAAMSEYEFFNFRKTSNPLPLFFLSHGGPTFADKKDKFGSDLGAWNKTREIGQFIKNTIKPDFIIVVSAHWQTDTPDEVEVSVPGIGEAWYKQNVESKKLRYDENALIYDFYGFPKRFYESQFHTRTNKFIADDIVKSLNESDWFQSKTQERGIDHGVFVPLKVAMGDVDIQDSGKLDLDIPLVQVSLAGTDDIEIQYRLGQVLSKYRDMNGMIIFSGMSVHNLQDLNVAMMNDNKPLPYVKPFNDILTNILTLEEPSRVLEEFKKLPRDAELRKLYKKAHPTNEHFLPAVVAAGASRGDTCKLLYTADSGSLGWNLYAWGITENSKL